MESGLVSGGNKETIIMSGRVILQELGTNVARSTGQTRVSQVSMPSASARSGQERRGNKGLHSKGEMKAATYHAGVDLYKNWNARK